MSDSEQPSQKLRDRYAIKQLLYSEGRMLPDLVIDRIARLMRQRVTTDPTEVVPIRAGWGN